MRKPNGKRLAVIYLPVAITCAFLAAWLVLSKNAEKSEEKRGVQVFPRAAARDSGAQKKNSGILKKVKKVGGPSAPAGSWRVIYSMSDVKENRNTAAAGKSLEHPKIPRDRFGRLLYKPGEVLVFFKQGVSIEQQEKLHAALGNEPVRDSMYESRPFVRVKLAAGTTLPRAVEQYEKSGLVREASPNRRKFPAGIPNDTDFSQQWGLNNTGQSIQGTPGTADADIDAPEAWDLTMGDSSVIVAMIDTGVNYNHEDLAANIWSNTDEAIDGSDTDGNGKIDDIRGWDFVDSDNDPMDADGHGTNTSGIVAAVTDNSTGIAGVAGQVTIMPLRVQGYDSEFYDAVVYACNNGAMIINYSFGGDSTSTTESDAVQYARNRGVLMCFPAGNGGSDNVGDDNDATAHWPSNYSLTFDNVLSSGGSNSDDDLCGFSNYGANSVSLFSPANNVYTTSSVSEFHKDTFDSPAVTPPALPAGYSSGGGHDDWQTVQLSGNDNCLQPSADYAWVNKTHSWCMGPVMDTTSYSGLKFGLYIGHDLPNAGDSLSIDVYDGSGWIQIDSFYGSSGGSITWFEYDVSAYSNANFQFRFRFDTDNSIDGSTPPGYWGALVDEPTLYGLGVNDQYEYFSGTSGSAPMTAGVLALVKSRFPLIDYLSVKQAVMEGVDVKPAFTGKCVSGGRLNAYNALIDSTAPTGLTLSSPADSYSITQDTLRLSWNPADFSWSGPDPARAYRVEVSTNGGFSSLSASGELDVSSTGWTTPALAWDTYWWRVTARDACGNDATSGSRRFTCVEPTHTISGNVTGDVQQGVTITLSGDGSDSTITGASGDYSFGVNSGSYTLVPTLGGYSFTPSSTDVSLSTSDISGINFIATGIEYTITGVILGDTAGGVTVTLSGGPSAPQATVTNTSGVYSFQAINGDYTVSPSATGYTFGPPSRNVTVNAADETGVNFNATQLVYNISGRVSGDIQQGVTITLSGDGSDSTTTNASGLYSFTNVPYGSYLVTPTLANYSFSPSSTAVVISGADVTGVDFVATQTAWSISGNVGGDVQQGVTITLSGDGSDSTVTIASGAYSFNNLSAGNYTLTPQLTGFSFSPSSTDVSISGADVTGVNFTATSLGTLYNITGTVSGDVQQGVTITLSGDDSQQTVTGPGGSYSFQALDGNYQVTPDLAGYTFTPVSRSITVSGGDYSGVDFIAATSSPEPVGPGGGLIGDGGCANYRSLPARSLPALPPIFIAVLLIFRKHRKHA